MLKVKKVKIFYFLETGWTPDSIVKVGLLMKEIAN